MALWRCYQKLCAHQNNSSTYNKMAACLKGSWQHQTSALPGLVFQHQVRHKVQCHTGSTAKHPTRFLLSATRASTHSTPDKDGINHLPRQQLSSWSQGLTLPTPSLQQSHSTPMLQASGHAAQMAALLAET